MCHINTFGVICSTWVCVVAGGRVWQHCRKHAQDLTSSSSSSSSRRRSSRRSISSRRRRRRCSSSSGSRQGGSRDMTVCFCEWQLISIRTAHLRKSMPLLEHILVLAGRRVSRGRREIELGRRRWWWWWSLLVKIEGHPTRRS